MPWAPPPRAGTRFVEDPPDEALLATLGVLRRERTDEDVLPFEEPDWLPMFSSLNVLHCRRLAGPEPFVAHLVAGDTTSERAGSGAAVFVEAHDTLALQFGPASAVDIARGGLVDSATGDGITLQLVPDGVAAVRLGFADGSSAVEKVVENLWWHRRGEPLDPFASSLCWLDADGGILRRFG